MAGMLDDLFEDLIKEPDSGSGNSDAGGEPNGQDKPDPGEDKDEAMEHDGKSLEKSLFPMGDEWKRFKEQGMNRA